MEPWFKAVWTRKNFAAQIFRRKNRLHDAAFGFQDRAGVKRRAEHAGLEEAIEGSWAGQW